ncbi:MAG: peptidylprolyl isomerase [Hyphomicrobium sp.]
MRIVHTFLREPMVHFFAFALLIFMAFRVFNPDVQDQTDRIVVSEEKIEQLAGLFTKTWKRPPTAPELKGLIDDFVKEEISYREALALGLDKDDTVIRRRMRQKLEFFVGADADPVPADAELLTYLEAHAKRYAAEPLVAFSQVYFDPQKRPSTIDADIDAALARLRAGTSLSTPELGDVTMLPQAVPLSTASTIAREFGADFADAVVKADTGKWLSPIKSSFGLHLVLVNERREGQRATLDQVKAAVVRDLSEDKRKEREARRFAELLRKYDVIIANPAASKANGPEDR